MGIALDFVSHRIDILGEEREYVNNEQANLTTIRFEQTDYQMRKPANPFVAAAYAKIAVIFFLVASSGGHAQKTKGARCLSYEPSVVHLTGTLVHKAFPGPPNYEDLRRGDTPEILWLLNLAVPICVDQDKEQPDLNPSHKKIRTIQLVLPGEFYSRYKDLIGKQIIVTGKLFGAHTIHHRTPVLITVSSLAEADQTVR